METITYNGTVGGNTLGTVLHTEAPRMIRRLRFIACVILGYMVLMSVLPLPVAASFGYYIKIEVFNNSTTVYSNLPLLITVNNSQLQALGYIDADGLDTDVQEGATSRAFMVHTSRVGLVTPSLLGNQDRDYMYRLDNSPEQTSFPVVVGVGGYVTVSDNTSLELGSNFTVEIGGYIDTSAVGGNITYKEGSFSTYVSSEGNITSVLGSSSYAYSYPDSDVDINIPTVVGNATHYGAIDEPWGSPDDADYLSTATETWDYDTYGLTDLVPEITPSSFSVIEVQVCYRGWGVTEDGEARVCLILGGNETCSSNITTPSGSAVNYTRTLSRPGGGSWSISDLNNLQAKLHVRSTADGWGVRFSQLYVRVTCLPTSVTATGISEGEHVVKTTADNTTLKIYVDGNEKDSIALAGVSSLNTSNDWILMQDEAMPYLGYYKHTVNGTMVAHYEPSTMVGGTVLTNRISGNHTGVITWGTNPADIAITLSAVEAAESYTAAVGDTGDVPEVLPPPPEDIQWTEAEVDPDMSSMPMYDAVHRAAGSLGWSDNVLYMVLMFITSLGLGFAGLIASGSAWGFSIGFGVAMGTASSTAAMPVWIGVISVLMAIFLAYIWKYM